MDREFTYRKIAIRYVVSVILWCSLVGCGSNSDEYIVKEASSDDRGGNENPVTFPIKQVDHDNESNGSAQLDGIAKRPLLRSNSAIDQIAEGSLYRQALDAVDHGQNEFALKAKAALAKHPTYGILGEAINVLVMANEKRFDDAMAATEKLSTVQIMQPESYMLAADVFRLQGRLREAIDCLNSSLQLNPGNARAQRWLGIIYYDIGAMQQATIHLRNAADVQSSDVGSLRLSSRIFFEYQNFFEAAEDSRQALARQPTTEIREELRLRLAESLRELREFDDALDVLESCSSSADAWTIRGKVYEAKGNQKEAIDACRKAIEHQVDNRMANLVLGRVLLADRKVNEALPYLELAASLDSTDHESRFLLGRCLLISGQREKGEEMIALATMLKERFLKITELHRQAIDDPASADLRFRLGELLEASDRLELARMWYHAAIGLDGNHAGARKAMEKILLK